MVSDPQSWLVRFLEQWRDLRDVLLFFGGLAGIAHETLIWSGEERYFLLVLFAGMVGLTGFLRTDGKEPPR